MYDSSDEDDNNLQESMNSQQELFRRSVMYMAGNLLTQIQNPSIPRPYNSHLLTESGDNRLLSMRRVIHRFGGQAIAYLRFSCEQIELILEHMQVPVEFKFDGYKTSGTEALVISLYRLSSGARFLDMSYLFDLLPSFISQIFAGFMSWMYDTFAGLVRSFDHPWTTERAWLEHLSSKTYEKGCPLRNCFGFVDGTHIKVCRPSREQRSWYCGHHHTHCFKCLVIQLPNGIVLAFGPFNGSTHDSSQAEEIALNDLLRTYCSFSDNTDFLLYGDSGFAVGHNLVTPFRRNRNHTPDEANWNQEMSRSRITVEWGIGSTKKLFQLLANKRNLRTLLSPVAVYWFNCIFLTNVHTCLNGSCQVSEYFDISPPSLEDYLAS